jgi:hypothetical protein
MPKLVRRLIINPIIKILPQQIKLGGRMPRIIIGAIWVGCLILPACRQDPSFQLEQTNQQLLSYIKSIKKIDTHEHLLPNRGFFIYSPGDYDQAKTNFYHVVSRGYLGSDLTSAGAPAKWDTKKLDQGNMEELWDLYGKYLPYARSTTYYQQLREGFRVLYGFNEMYFTPENIKQLSRQLSTNYADFPRWFDTAFQKAGFALMFLDQWWSQFNVNIDTQHFALVFRVDNLVDYSILRSQYEKDDSGDANNNPFILARQWNMPVQTLKDYLAVCERCFKLNVEHHAVAIKIGPAYTRTLDIDDVPLNEAESLYRKSAESMPPAQKKRLQDFMFHWVVKTAAAKDLPVQVHTGYLAGNYRSEGNADPMKLNSFILAHPEAKFMLFHGGFPWYGAIAALAKNIPNVYVDMVWLPQISRETAVNALQQWLDCVPYNKMFCGWDGHHIEESVGGMSVTESVVAEVLAERVSKGRLTMEVAREIASAIFRNNAIREFKLEQKLGRKL